jgi:hypothetical protein
MSETIYRSDFFELCRYHPKPAGMISCNLWSGDKTKMQTVQEAIEDCFGSSLNLPVPNRGNVVCIAGRQATISHVKNLGRTKCDQLSSLYHINFRSIWKECFKHNAGILERFSLFLH